MGICQIFLSEIVGGKQSVCISSFLDNDNEVMGKIIIKADKVRPNFEFYKMTWKARGMKDTGGWFGKADP